VMVGLCFAGTMSETQAGIQSVQGVVFMLVTENTFMPMYSTLALFPLELPLFVREYRSGLYSTHLFYSSKMAALVSRYSLVSMACCEPELAYIIRMIRIFSRGGGGSVARHLHKSICTTYDYK
jgi:hypothetical protein